MTVMSTPVSRRWVAKQWPERVRRGLLGDTGRRASSVKDPPDGLAADMSGSAAARKEPSDGAVLAIVVTQGSEKPRREDCVPLAAALAVADVDHASLGVDVLGS
jgi:hypothetical protein